MCKGIGTPLNEPDCCAIVSFLFRISILETDLVHV